MPAYPGDSGAYLSGWRAAGRTEFAPAAPGEAAGPPTPDARQCPGSGPYDGYVPPPPAPYPSVTAAVSTIAASPGRTAAARSGQPTRAPHAPTHAPTHASPPPLCTPDPDAARHADAECPRQSGLLVPPRRSPAPPCRQYPVPHPSSLTPPHASDSSVCGGASVAGAPHHPHTARWAPAEHRPPVVHPLHGRDAGDHPLQQRPPQATRPPHAGTTPALAAAPLSTPPPPPPAGRTASVPVLAPVARVAKCDPRAQDPVQDPAQDPAQDLALLLQRQQQQQRQQPPPPRAAAPAVRADSARLVASLASALRTVNAEVNGDDGTPFPSPSPPQRPTMRPQEEQAAAGPAAPQRCTLCDDPSTEGGDLWECAECWEVLCQPCWRAEHQNKKRRDHMPSKVIAQLRADPGELSARPLSANQQLWQGKRSADIVRQM